jgi:D-3-phosphoglycerate dehydrogenase / 2-oxoglutarate reductase
MPGYKIVFTDYYYPSNEEERKILTQLGDVEIVDGTLIQSGGLLDEDDIIAHAQDADAVIVQFARMTKKVIDSLQKCRIIARYAIGLDTIDMEAAAKKGIVVANVPDYCVEEVSDTAIAHMLNCTRKVSLANELLHTNQWAYEKIKPIKRFSEHTIGLLAFGNIARRTAEKLSAFNVRLMAYDPYFTDNESYEWIEFVSLETLLSRADIVSIHAPLTPETRHLLNNERFDLMKDGVIVINSSRGELIEEKALLAALEDGKVAMAGLDVLEYPDGEYDQSALLGYRDKVFITPHMGWYSEQSIADLQAKTARNVYEMLTNGQPLYSVEWR